MQAQRTGSGGGLPQQQGPSGASAAAEAGAAWGTLQGTEAAYRASQLALGGGAPPYGYGSALDAVAQAQNAAAAQVIAACCPLSIMAPELAARGLSVHCCALNSRPVLMRASAICSTV